jgi:hypothetical protein
MRDDGWIGIHLVAIKEEMCGFGEGNNICAVERERTSRADGSDFCFDGYWIDCVRRFSKEPKEDSSIGSVADTSKGERAVKLDEDRCGTWEETGGLKLTGEAKSRSHGTDGVRAGRSYADFEKFEEAGVHDLITIEFHCKGELGSVTCESCEGEVGESKL